MIKFQYFFLINLLQVYNFQKNITFFAPLEIASKPKDPTPENRSKILQFLIFFLINSE